MEIVALLILATVFSSHSHNDRGMLLTVGFEELLIVGENFLIRVPVKMQTEMLM